MRLIRSDRFKQATIHSHALPPRCGRVPSCHIIIYDMSVTALHIFCITPGLRACCRFLQTNIRQLTFTQASLLSYLSTPRSYTSRNRLRELADRTQVMPTPLRSSGAKVRMMERESRPKPCTGEITRGASSKQCPNNGSGEGKGYKREEAEFHPAKAQERLCAGCGIVTENNTLQHRRGSKEAGETRPEWWVGA